MWIEESAHGAEMAYKAVRLREVSGSECHGGEATD